MTIVLPPSHLSRTSSSPRPSSRFVPPFSVVDYARPRRDDWLRISFPSIIEAKVDWAIKRREANCWFRSSKGSYFISLCSHQLLPSTQSAIYPLYHLLRHIVNAHSHIRKQKAEVDGAGRGQENYQPKKSWIEDKAVMNKFYIPKLLRSNLCLLDTITLVGDRYSKWGQLMTINHLSDLSFIFNSTDVDDPLSHRFGSFMIECVLIPSLFMLHLTSNYLPWIDSIIDNSKQQARKAKRSVIFKRAEQYVNEYKKAEREEIRLKRVAKASGDFYVPAQPKVFFVMRIKGYVASFASIQYYG